MLLVADVGNTNVVFALFADDPAAFPVLRVRWRIATDPRRTGDEYAAWLIQLLAIEGLTREDITRFIIGSVVPRANSSLIVLGRRYLGIQPLIAGEGACKWPLEFDIPEPQMLGADRALNAIAGHALHDGDLIIVDFGTATTFDVVGYDGVYKGGVIMPGAALSLEALVGNTAKLPRVAIAPPPGSSSIGRTTEEQMQIGVFRGYLAMFEGLVDLVQAEVGSDARVIATGGLAALFADHTARFDAVDPDLTLKGLALVARQHTS